MPEKKKQLVVISPRRRAFVILLAVVGLGAVLFLMESMVAGLKNPVMMLENIRLYLVLNVNILLIFGLLFVVFRNLIKLFLEHRQKVLGSRIKVKLVVAFISFSLFPLAMMFLVSSNLISSTIENWLDSQSEEAMQNSLAIAQHYYEDSLGNAFTDARDLVKILSQLSESLASDYFDNQRVEQLIKEKQKHGHLGMVKVVFPAYKLEISQSNQAVPESVLGDRSAFLISEGMRGVESSQAQSGYLTDSVVPINAAASTGEPVGVLLFNFYDPLGLQPKITQVKILYKDYAMRKNLKDPLQKTYQTIMLVATSIILFSAIWIGFQMAKRITVPFQELVEGTREVAAGNLDHQVTVEADDEVKILVDSFNKMTGDLKQAYHDLQTANVGLEERRNYIEALLENVAAGVFSADSAGKITTVNKSVNQLLKLGNQVLLGRFFADCFKECKATALTELLEEIRLVKLQRLQRPVTLNIKNNPITLLVSVTALTDLTGAYQGVVVVLEDLTRLIKAQKVAAWSEVARRITHEIKNPLTPIKLSAERLRKNYGREGFDFSPLLESCTRTIIDEVDDMKNLVDEFSRFSRMPVVKKTPVNINHIVSNTINRYHEHPDGVCLTVNLARELPRILLDAGQIKRVLVNLIDNAIAALEDDKIINISTKYNQELQSVILEVSDHGTGISAQDKVKLFLPYFSTKKAGTGLGLTITHKIITDHRGYIRIADNQPRGTRFLIELPTGGV